MARPQDSPVPEFVRDYAERKELAERLENPECEAAFTSLNDSLKFPMLGWGLGWKRLLALYTEWGTFKPRMAEEFWVRVLEYLRQISTDIATRRSRNAEHERRRLEKIKRIIGELKRLRFSLEYDESEEALFPGLRQVVVLVNRRDQLIGKAVSLLGRYVEQEERRVARSRKPKLVRTADWKTVPISQLAALVQHNTVQISWKDVAVLIAKASGDQGWTGHRLQVRCSGRLRAATRELKFQGRL